MMIVDHLMYDLKSLLPKFFSDYPQAVVDFAKSYWNWDVRIIIRPFALFSFLGVSGICCSFSKSNISRGAKLMGVAFLLTLATSFIGYMTNNNDMTITFGALHCIALSLLLIGLLEKISDNKWIYLILGTILFGVGLFFELSPEYGKHLSYGTTPIYKYLFEQIVGLKSYGSDSFAFTLHGGQIFIGVFLGKLLYSKKRSLFRGAPYRNNFLTFIGRHSLFVYFAHQILIPLLGSLIFAILGYTFAL